MVTRRTNDLVICSLESWDDVWRRNQFLVRELLRRDPELRVLFIEPPVDLLHARSRRGRLAGRSLRSVPGHHRLWRLRPIKVLPRLAGPFADASLGRQLLGTVRRLGFGRPTLWINDASYAPLADRLGWPTVYDITDDWLLASATPRQRRRLEQREALLMKVANEVTVCSPMLAETRGAARDVVLIPNAVDIEHFRRARSRPAEMPSPPTAVYVGTLHEDRLDVELCLRLAAGLPYLQVILVGPCSLRAESHSRLSQSPNVHVLGPRPYDAVPAYLQHADVIVVPHLVTPFTESLDPIKAYECLAVETPTVATPVAGFRELSPEVTVVASDEFVDAVKETLGRPRLQARDRAVPTWQERAARFAEVLEAATEQAERPLRVVYLDHCAQLSGAELGLLRLLPALAGVEASVVLAEDGPLVGELEKRGVAVTVLPMSERARSLTKERVRPGLAALAGIPGTVFYVARVASYLRSHRADLVHTNSLKAALYGGVAGRLAGVPVVWHVRDRIAHDYLPRAAVLQVRAALRCLPQAVIANSASTLATLRRPRFTTVRVEAVVHTPVEPGRASAAPAPSPLHVGIVGRIAPWKGQDLFLRAFARAFPFGPERAVIVGGPLFGEQDFEVSLRALAGQLGIGNRVEFRGFRNDVAGELARLHVLVHASVIPEPFGQVVVEGMAAGLAVVAPNAGGPAEVVTDEVDGVLYQMADVGALAQALVRVGRDPDLRVRLGEAARRTARGFQPEAVAPEVLSVYEQVMSRRPIDRRWLPRFVPSRTTRSR